MCRAHGHYELNVSTMMIRDSTIGVDDARIGREENIDRRINKTAATIMFVRTLHPQHTHPIAHQHIEEQRRTSQAHLGLIDVPIRQAWWRIAFRHQRRGDIRRHRRRGRC